MSMFKLNFIKISTLIFASQLFFTLAVGADFEETTQVLLIGRPEWAGVSVKEAPGSFSKIGEDSFWYLDPRSNGSSSISERFPCSIPEGKPKQFEIVCLEQGMLNEVVTHASIPASSSMPQMATSQVSSFDEEDEAVLNKLQAERDSIWEKWRALQDVDLKEMRARLIMKALEAELIEESWELGNKYYRIIGSQNTCVGELILDRLFATNEKALPEERQEFQDLNKMINNEFEKMIQKDKLIDPLAKRRDASAETATMVHQVQTDPSDPSEVYEQIESFLLAAWHLVSPGGTMIVFSGNARIDGTKLADGISKNYLESFLSDLVEIEEIAFPDQRYEGEKYISNPVFPAKMDAFGWTGGRSQGSYLLIKKAR